MDDDSYSTFDGDGALSVWFLLNRGFCCGNGCRNCPYRPRHAGPGAQERDDLEIGIDGRLLNPAL